MRIISKFKDYYDCGMAYGVDPQIVYVREEKYFSGRTHEQKDSYDVKNSMIYHGPIHRSEWHKYHMFPENVEQKSGYIGFAGEVYRYKYLLSKDDAKFCFSPEHVLAFFENNCTRKQIDGYTDQRRISKWSREKHASSCKEQIQRFFDRKKESNFFERFDCPIWATDLCDNIVVNPCLEDFTFYRCIDAYQAWQKLSMYMMNHAFPDKPNPVISDELKAHSRGYDKWSFRKLPSKQRKKKDK